MAFQVFLSILVVLFSAYNRPAAAQQVINKDIDELAGNIDLEEMGAGDQGQPLKRNVSWLANSGEITQEISFPEFVNVNEEKSFLIFCKDIWTICGIWSVDYKIEPRPCCRSEGPNRIIRCRHPSTYLKEFHAGFSRLHWTYCLPIAAKETHWRSSARSNMGLGWSERADSHSVAPYSPRGDTGALLNEEILGQLTRIADVLDKEYKKP